MLISLVKLLANKYGIQKYWELTIVFLFMNLNVTGQNESISFDRHNNHKAWNLVFEDDGTTDWTQYWTLDGLIATVENSKVGMHFKAGPEYKNDAHHAVLWTKASFTGDVKIEYDYIKTDSEERCVNILYLLATGDKEGVYDKDISKWASLRQIPAMRTYYENMNTFHISYSAFNNHDKNFHYVRARRYPKLDNKSFKTTLITPSYDRKGLFKTGQKYHITAIKTKEQLFFRMKSEEGEEVFEWSIINSEPVEMGRVGLRQMYTRSSIYKNFKIYTK